MPEHFPIFVGITGKRKFSDDAEIAKQLEDGVRHRLSKTFEYIESRLPIAPKILLTGGAIGADLIAAEELLFPSSGIHRKHWLVAVILPFEEALFQQDFNTDEWERYRRVTSDPRTLVWELPLLRWGTDNQPLNREDIERPGKTEFQRDARRRHYEQVGLWISDQSNILVGVMPANEQPKNIGGTARILGYRRGGWPDAITQDIIAASSVLAPRRELYRPPTGYVWLVDPLGDASLANPPVTVLPPHDDEALEPVAHQRPGVLSAKALKKSRQRKALRASQRPLRIAVDYAVQNLVDVKPELRWKDFQLTDRTPDKVLDSIARELEPYAPAEKYRRFIYMQVGGFLLAVLAFEIFAKYLHDDPKALGAYLIVLLAGLGLFTYVEWTELQPVAEDRRAVREALRVQSAWWQAGLDKRIDHYYLEGAGGALVYARDAARNIITWAQLKCGGQGAENWKAVFAPETWPRFSRKSPNKIPRDWVGNQLFYFRHRKDQRNAKAELFENMSWLLFVTAAFLSLLLLLWLFVDPGHTQAPYSWFDQRGDVLPALLTVVGTAGAALCWWLSERLLHRVGLAWRRLVVLVAAATAACLLFFAMHVTTTIVGRHEVRWAFVLWMAPALLVAVYFMIRLSPAGAIVRSKLVVDVNEPHPVIMAFALGAVLLFGFALQLLPPLMHETRPSDATIAMTIIYIIFLPALGATMRFLSEKTALEAETHSYRDAFCWYAHAAELLRELKPGNGNRAADERSRELVERLGKMALTENEMWLKSRRQRPLSPLI